MPPKAAADKSTKTYSADIVAALLVATGTTSLSMKNYELMSAIDGVKTASAFQHDFRAILSKAKDIKTRIDSGEEFETVQPTAKRAVDGTRTASSFEHQFRAVITKAKELKKRVEDGEEFSAVTAHKRGATTTPATPTSGKKRKGDSVDDTPSKKTKATPKPRGKKAATSTPTAPPADTAFDHDDLPADMDDFIKGEKKWEEENDV